MRSLTCYRSVLVMRSIPGLLGTAPEGSSLGMPRHLLKEHSSSTPSASSSDLEDSSYPTKAFTAPAANLGTQKNLEHSGDGKEQREQQRGSVSSSSDFSVQGSNGDKSYGSVLSSSVAVERQPQIISELGLWGFPEGAESPNICSQPLAELRLSKSSTESSVSQAATVGKGDFPAEEGATTSSSVRGISADRALALPIQGEERAQASVDGSSKPPCTLLPRHSVIRSTFYSDVQASPLQLSRDPSAEQGQYSSSLESMRKRIVQAGYSTGNVSGLRQPLLECFQTDVQDLTADRALGSASVSPVPTADSLLYFAEQSSRKIKSLDELETKVLAQPAARESERDTLKPFLLCDEDSEPDSSAVVFAHYSNIARPVYLGQRDSAVMESRSGLAEEAKGLRYGLKYSTKGIPLAAKVNQSAHIGFVSSPCPETGTDLGLGVGKKICLTSSSESHERCSEAGASAFWWGSPEPQTTTRAASTASNEGIGFVGSGSVKQYSDDPSVLPSVSQSKCPDSQGSSKCPSRPSSAPASDLTSQRQEEASRENTSSSYFDAVKVETDYFDLSDPCSSELLRSKEFEEKSISKNRPIPAGYVSKEQFPLGYTEAASAIQSEDTMSAASSEVSCDETGLMDDGYRDLAVDIWESDMLQLLDDTELDEGNGGAGDEAEGESDKTRKSSLERKMHQTFQSLKKTFKTSRGSKSSASSSDTSLSRSESHAETLPRSTSTKFGKAGILGLFRRSTSLNWDRGLADKEDGRSRYSLSVLQDLDSHERLRELKGKKKSKPLPASLEGRSAAENSGRQERQKGESDETPARPDPLKVELDQSQYMEIVKMPSKSAPIALEDGAEEKPEDLPTPSGDVPSDSPKKKSRLFSFQFPGTKPKEKAPSFLEGLQNQLVVLNQSVTLSCTPSGRPNPAIYWFKDDLPICSSKRMKLSATVQGCQLVTIWSVTEEDLGRYECVAENSLGKASTGCCVTGAAVPHRPDSPEVAQVSDDGALVIWKPVESNTPVTYVIECRRKDDLPICSSKRMKLSATVQGCQLVTIWSVTEEDLGRYECVAENSLGKASTGCCVTGAAVPHRPDSPEVAQVSDDGALVIWKPVESNTPVTYVIECRRKGESWKTISSDSSECNYYATNLQKGEAYSFKIGCFNKAGKGPFSQPSVEVVIGETEVQSHNIHGKRLTPVHQAYTFCTELNRGRTSIIKECTEISSGKSFAAKITAYKRQNHPFVLREYETLRKLHHRSIVELHAAYITPKYLVLIQELCRGTELLHHLAARASYTEHEVVSLLEQLLGTVQFLHFNHMLHLDLRSENMMIVEGEKLKLLDFGSAQHLTAARPAHVGKCGDFVENMAPEILDCKALVPETDIWAVGVLTFTMLSGDCPFTSDKESDKEKNIRKGKVKIGRCYTGLSQGAISFLKSTLCRNAGGRPSGSECLALPWLQEDSRAKLRHSAVSFQTSKLRSYLKQREKHRKLLCTQHKVLLPE